MAPILDQICTICWYLKILYIYQSKKVKDLKFMIVKQDSMHINQIEHDYSFFILALQIKEIN
jgi:hypothetical protein